MGLLEGKNALVFGLANERSIAWGITQAFHREGANIGISYAGEMLERRVKPLAEKVGCTWVEECDVTSDEQIAVTAEKAAKHFGQAGANAFLAASAAGKIYDYEDELYGNSGFISCVFCSASAIELSSSASA